MEEILKKANEIGLLLKKTDTFKLFEETAQKVNNDNNAGALLKRYNEIAESIKTKQDAGYPIESFEKENFKEITEIIMNNSLLREYLLAREKYMNLLTSIQQALSDSNDLLVENYGEF